MIDIAVLAIWVAATSETPWDPRVTWPRKACGDLCGSSLDQPRVVEESFRQEAGRVLQQGLEVTC